MSNVIFTIGREFGSGGHEIGKKLAQDLRINFYDKEILKEASKKYGFATKVMEKFDEKPASGLSYLMNTDIAGTMQPLSMQIFIAQCNTIKTIAKKESCVFVGRCSNYVLRDFDNVINVFVHSPIDLRIERIEKRKNLPADKALDLIIKTDKKRSTYYNYYTDLKWSASQSYNLCIDTSKTGIDGAVELIKKYKEIVIK